MVNIDVFTYLGRDEEEKQSNKYLHGRHCNINKYRRNK